MSNIILQITLKSNLKQSLHASKNFVAKSENLEKVVQFLFRVKMCSHSKKLQLFFSAINLPDQMRRRSPFRSVHR